MNQENNRTLLVSLLLRLGIAAVFLYPAIASFIEPDAWIGYFPLALRKIFPENFLRYGFAIFEIIVALWLLSGKKIFYAALLAAFTLAAVIVANFGAMDIIFRDFGLLFAALALAMIDCKSGRE